MRRFVTAVLSVSLALSMWLMTGATASANALAGGGYSSSYSGESVFTNVAASGSGQFSAIFFNDGTQAWAPGVVGLLICLPDKVTCNVASPNAAYASGWYSSTVYATVSATVAPGQNGFFIYNFAVPAGTAGGTAATFNGDVGLIATGAELRPEGYYQINTTPSTTTTLTISPTSAALPVGGQQQFTVSGAAAGATVTWTVTGGCGAVTTSGLFAATATNSPTQPCAVVASAGGASVSAPVTVFGSATHISCAAAPTSIPADNANSTTTVTGTLLDANGNVVANNSSTNITFSNSTPTILTADNGTEPETITSANGVASKVYDSTTTSGTAVISLSASGLTGCNVSIATTKPGAAAQLVAGFSPTTIASDGSSTSKLTVNVKDANGVLVASSTDTIAVSQTSGTSVCSIKASGSYTGSGGSASGSASSGVATFTIQSTSTPGTCSFSTSDSSNTSVSSSSATLTTVITGAANKLVVTNTPSSATADNAATIVLTVKVEDANGNVVTGDSTDMVTPSTVSGCSGTNAAGTSGSVPMPAAQTVSAGVAKFTFTSTFATSGCTVKFSSGTLSTASATIVFTPGGAVGVACKFSPGRIAPDGSSVSIATVAIVDKNNNAVGSGTYSTTFAFYTYTAGTTGGVASAAGPYTTQVTLSPQNTTNGSAPYTVQSKKTTGANSSEIVGTDTYSATATINGATVTTQGNGSTTARCSIGLQQPPIQ